MPEPKCSFFVPNRRKETVCWITFTADKPIFFSFYRLPKALFADTRFRGISAESKILYGLLLDRMSLSIKSGWLDKQGRVYIIFTTDEIMKAFYCADNKATKLMKELEGCGLIERKRRGLGRPSLICVKNFIFESSKRNHAQFLHCPGTAQSECKIIDVYRSKRG